MNLTLPEARELATAIVRASLNPAEAELVLAPAFTALSEVGKILEGSPVQLAAQDMFWEEKGAFTGEVSPLMVKEAGCRYVIIGHSERRQHFGELDAAVNKKVQAALRHGLVPIMCLGETLAERERGETMDRVSRQVEAGLAGVAVAAARPLVIAYEPVWAIGTGRTAAPEQAEEVHGFIREKIARGYGNEAAACAIILYGGSVKPANARALLSQKDIDGFLVGGASLEAESFIGIAREAIEAVKEKT
jgi:triosephosphate isomerase